MQTEIVYASAGRTKAFLSQMAIFECQLRLFIAKTGRHFRFVSLATRLCLAEMKLLVFVFLHSLLIVIDLPAFIQSRSFLPSRKAIRSTNDDVKQTCHSSVCNSHGDCFISSSGKISCVCTTGYAGQFCDGNNTCLPQTWQTSYITKCIALAHFL